MSNMSRKKGNHTMKFGQLIECNIRNILMEKLVPDPFLKNWNWAYLWINSLRFYTVYFYCMSSWGPLKQNETKLQITFLKRGLARVSLPHFPHNLWRKTFLLLYCLYCPSFIVWLLLLREILCNICIVIVC